MDMDIMQSKSEQFSKILSIVTKIIIESKRHKTESLENIMRIIYPCYDHNLLQMINDDQKRINGFICYGLFNDEDYKAYMATKTLPPFARFHMGKNKVTLLDVQKS